MPMPRIYAQRKAIVVPVHAITTAGADGSDGKMD
jgi:hypothetical protein